MSVEYIVNTSRLNVRSAPDTSNDNNIVGVLTRGQRVTVSIKKGTWGCIGTNKWCSMNYLLSLTDENGNITPSVTCNEVGRPIFFMQSDKRWAQIPYTIRGDSSQTIKSSACGPTCGAMLVNTYCDKTYSPIDACEWALSKGYRTDNNGTAWGFFKALAVKYGFNFLQTGSISEAKQFMKTKPNAHMVCVMSKGNWTSGGHYILVYKIDDTYVYVNDPASTAAKRLKNTITLLASQCRQYFCFSYGSGSTTWTEQNKEESVVKKFAVSASALNIRSQPSTDSSTLGTFKEGVLVTSSKKCGDWYYVTGTASNGKSCTGWCSATYLEEANLNNVNSGLAADTKNAINYLVKIKFMDSPDWWIQNAFSYNNITTLLIKIANRLKEIKNPYNHGIYKNNVTDLDNAIDYLVEIDVINSGDYWKNMCKTNGKLNNIGYLMIKTANFID